MPMSEQKASTRQRFLDTYKFLTPFMQEPLANLVGASQVEVLEANAAVKFEGLLEDIPYADQPEHVMAIPSLAGAIVLALYKAAEALGCSAHQFGRALHEAPLPELPPPDQEQYRPAAAESCENAAPNEFVFEFIEGDREDLDFGYNIKACAISYLYLKHDARDLLPYMCALDDKMSAARNSGLRRTGVIALGAHQCDFRYKAGGERLTLASQFRQQLDIE